MSQAPVAINRANGRGVDGVDAFHTAGLFVSNVVAVNNGEYGIARFVSTGAGWSTTTRRATAKRGLYIGDSPHANAFLAGNDVWGNGFWILVRHAQHASIQFNTIHDNCLGIFVVAGPAPTGRPVGQRLALRRGQDRPVAAAVGRRVDGAEQGDLSRLGALSGHPEQLVPAGIAQGLYSGVARFADPQAHHPQHGDQGVDRAGG